MEIPEFDQSPGDILQEQESYEIKTAPIETVICEPVRVLQLPARSGGFRSYDLTSTQAVRVLDRDPRRKRAVLQVFDTAGVSTGARLGGTQAEGLSENAYLLGLPGPGIAAGNVIGATLEITNMDEVWASAVGEACTLSVLNEQWAE